MRCAGRSEAWRLGAVTYQQRKEQQACTYPGCSREPADGHSQCDPHRDAHRNRNKKHMAWRRLVKRVQLGLGL